MFGPVLERTSARYSGTLKDELGNVVPGANLTALLLTLYDLETGTVLNSRSAQNVLNANGVTVDGSGVVVWLMDPADNAIVTTGRSSERHRAVFDIQWGTGKRSVHRIDIQVDNETVVTA